MVDIVSRLQRNRVVEAVGKLIALGRCGWKLAPAVRWFAERKLPDRLGLREEQTQAINRLSGIDPPGGVPYHNDGSVYVPKG